MGVSREEDEEECVRQLRGIGAEMDALAAYEARIAVTRRGLMRRLIGRHGWSQHEVARMLGISQAAVSKVLKKGEPASRKKA